MTLLQTIFIHCPGTIESISVSDKIFGRITMVALLVLSYGQSIVMSILMGSHSRIFLALRDSEAEVKGTWFTVFLHSYWAFWIVLTLAIRYWRNSPQSSDNQNLETNHLFLNFSMLLTLAAGAFVAILHLLIYQHMSMESYAQAICHIHLLFICLVVYNHVECRQFAQRKFQSWPGISHAICTRGNRVSPIEVRV